MKQKFDCIAVKRQAAAAIYEKTKEMSEEEEIAYWRERTRLMREELQATGGKRKSA